MNSKTTLLAIMFSFVFTSYSQTNQNKENPQAQKQETQKVPVKTIQVKGLVVSLTTKEPIQMGFVTIVGTNIGTLTDQDGNFVIQAPEGAKRLAFSANGYKAQIADINTKKEMKIKLIPKDK